MKKIYQFTLTLKDVDEHTPGLEDTLYQAGCDDALINYRNGTVYLDFDREATSLKEAVITAIKNIETSPLGHIVASVAPEDLVTISEIAARTSNTRQAVSLWTKDKRRQFFPKPIMKLSGPSPFWKWRDVTAWLYRHELINKQKVDEAIFLEDINVILEERDPLIQKGRQALLNEMSEHKQVGRA